MLSKVKCFKTLATINGCSAWSVLKSVNTWIALSDPNARDDCKLGKCYFGPIRSDVISDTFPFYFSLTAY